MRGATWIWAAALIALSACGETEQPAGDAGKLPPGQTLKLAPSEIADMKSVGAEITTQDQADALARIPGILTSLSVKEGDMVQKGQVIGRIVENRIGFETAAYGAQAAAAQAEAVRARADLERIQDLYRNGVYAKSRLEQAQAAARAADAQVAAASAQQRASASVGEQGIVLAPASGRVLRADVPAGSPVAPGMSIATITAGAPVLRLSLPETLAGKVRTGARVIVLDQDMPTGSREGVVSQVYPAVTNGQMRADATLPGLTTETVGRRVSVQIEVGRRTALVVPRHYVTTRYGIDQIDVVAADKRLSSVPVQTAPTGDPRLVEILSGAAAGDTLFAAGRK